MRQIRTVFQCHRTVSALGCDFEMAYNPLCRQTIARGVIPVVREWWSVSDDTGCELYCDRERP